MSLKYLSSHYMKFFILLIALMFPLKHNHAQNLIGYKSSDIQKYMTKNRKDMNSETVKNNMYKYLKYSDIFENETVLFFLNNDSVCKSIRLICSRELKTQKIKEFNSKLLKSGENKWIENRGGKDYLFEIKDELYSCIITIKPED